MIRSFFKVFSITSVFSLAACAGSASDDAASGAGAMSASTAHPNPNAINSFECTSVASSTSEASLQKTRLDIDIDINTNGVPSGDLGTGFESSFEAQFSVGFGVSHVSDSVVGGHAVSQYKIGFGADSILKGSTGGTLTIPTAFTKQALDSTAAANVATLHLTPSNTTVTYKCKKDTRKSDNGPATDNGPVFQGSAKDAAAKDSCVKTVASAVMDDLISAIEDMGVDIPDSFVFTSVDKTSDGFKLVVNGATVNAVVGSGCKVKSDDAAKVAGSVGE
jgi:hypothetical protein